jgi:hypothetical protein
MKAVVDAKMGDAAKDYDAKQIGAAFAVLTKDAKVEDRDPLRDAIRDSATVKTDDAQVRDAYEAMVADLAKASQPKHLQTA